MTVFQGLVQGLLFLVRRYLFHAPGHVVVDCWRCGANQICFVCHGTNKSKQQQASFSENGRKKNKKRRGREEETAPSLSFIHMDLKRVCGDIVISYQRVAKRVLGLRLRALLASSGLAALSLLGCSDRTHWGYWLVRGAVARV